MTLKGQAQTKGQLQVELRRLRARLADLEQRSEYLLRRRLQLERLVAQISTSFVQAKYQEIDSLINEALESLGCFSGVDRCYVFLIDRNPSRFSNTHEWCAPGIESRIGLRQDLAVSDFPWFWQKLSDSRIIRVPSIADLPPEAWLEKAAWQALHTQSMACVLIAFSGKPKGFLGFDRIQAQVWTDDDIALLETLADIFANAIERRQIETALYLSEQKFSQVFSASPDFITISSLQEGRLIDVNPAFERTLGYGREEAIGRTVSDLNLWADPSERERLIEILRTQGVVINFENKVRLKSGRIIHNLVSASPMEVDGEPCFLAISRDITERKLIENELRLAAQVFESSREAIVITDDSCHIISVNQAFSRITGYTAEEIRGKNTRLLNSGRQDRLFYEAMWQTINCTGYWQGEVWNQRKSGEVYPAWLSITAVKDRQGRVTQYIGVAADITEHKLAQERINYLAHYDVLTGLPNRALLQDRLSQVLVAAERTHEGVVIFLLDLNRFKDVNDTLGHGLGDQLLRTVAARLTHCVRAADTVGRLGGDEFVIVLPATGVDGAIHVAHRILAAVNEPCAIENYKLNITASIGISVYPHDGTSADTLIKNADTALHHAKDRGRNNFQFFTQDMNSTAFERMFLENALRLALQQQEFMLYYQPQLEIASGRIVGAEALIRWCHPGMGLISPVKFIPVAEDSQLIIPIGEWVLREVCRQNAEWQRAGLPAIPVAVNLSAVQFRHEGFKQAVLGALREEGLAARYLELELTESILMDNVEVTIDSLREFAQLGVKLTVDDFGTGYSSLSYLKRFSLDKLKIDRSFVRDLTTDSDDAAIVRAVIGLAHNLRLRVIAEGAETQEQFEFLRDEFCDEIQGYYYSKPLPAEEFARFLDDNAAPVYRLQQR